MIIKRTNKIALVLFVLLIGIFLYGGDIVLAQENNVINEGLQAFGNETILGQEDPRVIVARIIRILLGFLGTVALAIVLYGGFLYMTSGGSEEKVGSAKKWLINGIIGMAIILSSFALTSFIIGQLSDATGITNGDGTNTGTGGPIGGDSGYTVSISPTGTNKPVNVIIKVQFPYGHLPNSIENAQESIKVYQVSGDPETEVEVSGTFAISGRTINFTPSGECPAGCEAESCFDINAKYRVKIGNLLDEDSEKIVCPNPMLGYCKMAEFTTGSACDLEGPDITISQIMPQPLKQGALFSTFVGARDNGGIFALELCPGWIADASNLCREYLPEDNPTALGYAFYNLDSSEAEFNLSLGWHNVKLFGEDIVGYQSETSRRMLVASEACFDENDEFNCSLAGCEVPCDECEDEENCEYYCVENESGETVCSPWPYPIIDLVLPHYGPINSFITLQGRNFGAFGENSKVEMDGIRAGLACGGGSNSWNNNQAIVKVPEGASAGWLRLTDADNFYNDTSDSQSPGWKQPFLIQDEVSPWIGLCSLIPSEGQPGTVVAATGENFGDTGSVYFNQYTGTLPTSWTNTRIEGVRVPNLAIGYVNVQVTHDDQDSIISNPVRFRILPVADDLEIHSVTPSDGPQKQMITIKGRNFGSSGTVDFIRNENSYPALQPCEGNWHDTEIIVQVPADAPDNIYTLQVTGLKGTDSVDFQINNDPLTPGICSMSPNNGQAGTKINFIGTAFGDDADTISFTGDGEVRQFVQSVQLNLQDAIWSDTRISGVQVPPTAISGDVRVIVDDQESNPAYFKVGKCSADSDCSDGEVCCEKSYCTVADQCQQEITNSSYGWYFTTGVLPQIPKVLERECILGEYDESTSPSKNEQNACPNGLISFTFNMQMNTDDFALAENEVEILRCVQPGRQCNLEQCTADGGCVSEKYSVEIIGTDIDDNSLIKEVRESVYNNREVTQVVLEDYSLLPNTWYKVVVPAGLSAIDDNGKDVFLPSDYSWIFHTGTEDCELDSVLVNPAKGVIEEVYETQLYNVSGQAENCAILDVSGYNWNWNLNQYTEYLELINDENTRANFGLKASAQNGSFETPINEPAIVTASALISGATKSDSAELAVLFKNPRIISYWPNCDEACRNVELGAMFNTYMRKTEIENLDNNFIGAYKCDDRDCLSVAGKENLITSGSRVECISTTGVTTIGTGANTLDICNQLRIFPENPLDPSNFYRVLINEQVTSASGKTLTGLNFTSTGQTIGFCGNGNIEGDEECEAICRDRNSGAACQYDPSNENCVCNLANNPYCGTDCKFNNFPLCTATQTTNCCGNGISESYTGQFSVALEEQCEASCRKVVEVKVVAENADELCATQLSGVPTTERVSTACSCSYPTTCEAGEKVCAKYCSNDVNRSCTQDTLDCDCIEPKICQESFAENGAINYCTNNISSCTCESEKSCLLVDGAIGETCQTGDPCTCLESGYYQFSPTEKCFEDAVDDPSTSEDETRTKGTCVKKSYCSENLTEQCTANRDACTCVPLTSVAGASCPEEDLVCEQTCTYKKLETCSFGDPDCTCSLPTGCNNCAVTGGESSGTSLLDSFSWVFKVRDGEAYCRPERIEVLPTSYISILSGQKVAYSGIPYTKPDICSVNGQKLNAYDYNWEWSSNPSDRSVLLGLNDQLNLFNPSHQKLVALFGQTYAPVSQSGCGDNCLNQGSLLYGSVCGNGIIEKGEECDSDLNCDANCLNTGTPACFGDTVNDATAMCCGNGVVNTGEDCDGGSGCSDRCLNLGSNASGYTCGNGIKELGEDEDYGEIAFNAKYGLSSNCLFVGSDYPKQIINGNLQMIESAICGNGILEAGEECEQRRSECKTPDGDSCDPYNDDRCVCDKFQDKQCGSFCLLRDFPACGTVKVCQENGNSCTQNINPCDCVKLPGQVEGFCDIDNDNIQDANETISCVASIDQCTCIEQQITTNCCGNGVIEEYGSYTLNGDENVIREECEALKVNGEINCTRPALQMTCPSLNSVLSFPFDDNDNNLTSSTNGTVQAITRNINLINGGVRDKAFKFNNSVVDLENSYDFLQENAAISFWMRTTTNDTIERYVVTNLDYSSKGGFALKLQNGKLKTTITEPSYRIYRTLFSNLNVSDGLWHYVVLNIDNSVENDLYIRLYIDGNLQNTNRFTQDFDLRDNVVLGAEVSGVNTFSNYYLGDVDELQLFHRLLTVDEMKGQYDNCLQSGNSRIICAFGEPGCICEMPSWCTAGCLNAGVDSNSTGESFCGNGVVEPGEDAVCEAGRTNQFGAPRMNLTVLGYLQGSVLSETIKIVGGITDNVSFPERSAGIEEPGQRVSGTADFTYRYAGFGPPPPGCDLNTPPKGILTSPAEFNACPNSAIVIDFEDDLAFFEDLNTTNLNNHVKLEYLEASDKCNVSVTGIFDPIKRFVSHVQKFIGKLFGREASAQVGSEITDLVWCSESNYSTAVIPNGNQDGGTRLQLTTNNNLLKTKNYRVRLVNIDNNCGLNINDQVYTFSVKADVCELESVKVLQRDVRETGDVLIPDKVVNERNHDWEIIHYPMSGSTILQPVTGYNWEWKQMIENSAVEWSTGDSSLVDFRLGTALTDSDEATIDGRNKIGRTSITAHATITEDYFYGKVGNSVQGSGTVDVFLCENPWQIGTTNLGWQENGFNVRLMYCRDAGDINSTDDDLPALQVIEGQSVPLTPNLLKEYFFLRDGNDAQTDNSGDAIALRIYSNLDNLSASQWFKQNVPNVEESTLSPLKVACDVHPYYGTEVCYYGVRDGNTLYLVAGNLNDSNNMLYNNIYVLAYNLEANSVTTNIFSQMMNYLTFNINVDDSNVRWQIQRDIKRVVDISMLRRFLVSYFANNGTIPQIQSGSYVRGTTLSSWISWNSVLQGDLRAQLQNDPMYRGQIPEDPINYFEQYAPSVNYNGSLCEGDVLGRKCRSIDDQCLLVKSNFQCSVCASGSDPLTCYNSESLSVTIPPSEIFSSNSYLYGYQYITYNSALLYYNLEGNYQINNLPESSLLID